jgi:predicted XRE-type DNA-binding protein
MMKTLKKRSTTQSAVMAWIEDQLARDAKLRQRVEELLNEMRIEQDLVALREARGLSQSQLAGLLGMSQPAIAKIESGKVKNFELKTLVRYATVLGGRVTIEIQKRPPAKVVALRGKV